MTTRVVNIKREPYASDSSLYVYCGRPGRGQAGPFGNPFQRTEPDCLAKFERHFQARIALDLEFRAAVIEAGKSGLPLGCFCVSRTGVGPCHAKTIARWIDETRATWEK